MLYHIVSCCISSPACSAESMDFLRRYSADLHTSACPRIAMSPTGPRFRLLISSRYVKPAKPIAPPVAAHHRFTGFTGPYRTHWQCERFQKNQKPEVLTADNTSTTACGCPRHQPNSGTHRDGQTEGEDRWHLTVDIKTAIGRCPIAGGMLVSYAWHNVENVDLLNFGIGGQTQKTGSCLYDPTHHTSHPQPMPICKAVTTPNAPPARAPQMPPAVVPTVPPKTAMAEETPVRVLVVMVNTSPACSNW